jgi:membrane protease YdiL (CAAX protease family)
MKLLGALLEGPAAYVPRTGWPPWAVLPAALVIFALAVLTGALATVLFGALGGAPAPAAPGPAHQQLMIELAAWISGLQVGLIVLTAAAAGLYSSDRRAALALARPAGGWRVLPLALLPLFIGTALWTGLLLLWNPAIVVHDLRPFQELLRSDALVVVLLVISIGAPLSEELLFRGFIFSGLAKSRLGVLGTSLLTALLWTSLHLGYSIFGLVEVLSIGLYLSWLLVRTGSLWVTIFCHAVYNTVVALSLLFVTLPPGS